ncbi:ATP-binding protein [Duganella vulcania]|uniref:ATP-binding protein n=1 Tax=Duganella vulcania TaxID=2692166 RepID=A0A845GJ25_9BURK|nr:ATP-binding protein [Duganella vulcania]MYM92659.1 ATP-binding protein [Duganella vulcania]
MTQYFARPELAAQMAKQIIHPDVLSAHLRSGLFISGNRRTGKTSFVKGDLIPALEKEAALVIYADLWSDVKANPSTLIHDALKKALIDLQSPGSALLKRLSAIRNFELGAAGFKFGFKVDSVGTPGGATLAQVITEVVDQAQRDVVLIVDEVQQAMATEEGNDVLLALKAARDAVNLRIATPGHFLFIGTGSHRSMVRELTTKKTQAFHGAATVDYPLLGQDYVDDLMAKLRASGRTELPSNQAVYEAFVTLGHRPEDLSRALRQLLAGDQTRVSLDDALKIIAQALRNANADVELIKIEQLGTLAEAIFDRIASSDGDAKGVFSGEAATAYSTAVGREVRVEEIQPVVNELVATNLVMRRGHGLYAVSDPVVQASWRQQRQDLLGQPENKAP